TVVDPHMHPSAGRLRSTTCGLAMPARALLSVTGALLGPTHLLLDPSANALFDPPLLLVRPLAVPRVAVVPERGRQLAAQFLTHPAHLLAEVAPLTAKLLAHTAHLLAELCPSGPRRAGGARRAAASELQVAADEQVQPRRAIPVDSG